MPIKAVAIDAREPEWVRRLAFGDAPTVIQALPCGDAWITVEDAVLIVERKTLPDLVASVADGRIFRQSATMVQASPWSYVAITSLPVMRSGLLWLDGHASRWQWGSVSGALATVQEMGVVVVWGWLGDPGYQTMLISLANRKRAPVRPSPRRDVEMVTAGEAVLCSLPGVSRERAQALLQHCGSAAWALQYLTGEGGDKVEGIGPATKEKTRKAVGLDGGTQLVVVSTEGREEENADAKV